MGCPFLLQGIFLTQGLNLRLHCRRIFYLLSHQGSTDLRRPKLSSFTQGTQAEDVHPDRKTGSPLPCLGQPHPSPRLTMALRGPEESQGCPGTLHQDPLASTSGPMLSPTSDQCFLTTQSLLYSSIPFSSLVFRGPGPDSLSW